jgi:hypothetical protein
MLVSEMQCTAQVPCFVIIVFDRIIAAYVEKDARSNLAGICARNGSSIVLLIVLAVVEGRLGSTVAVELVFRPVVTSLLP